MIRRRWRRRGRNSIRGGGGGKGKRRSRIEEKGEGEEEKKAEKECQEKRKVLRKFWGNKYVCVCVGVETKILSLLVMDFQMIHNSKIATLERTFFQKVFWRRTL